MKILPRILTAFFLMMITSFCTVSEKSSSFQFENINSAELLSRILPEYFEVTDSCILEYPLYLFPKAISDITITENSIYVFGISANTVYPIVMFTKDGKYKQTISRIGNGPGEIPLEPTKISVFKQKLAVASLGLNRITIFEDGKFIRDKTFDIEHDNIQIKDVLVYDDDFIFVYCNSFANYNLFILNDKLEIVQKLFELPPSTSLTSLIGYRIWGMQRNGDRVVSHTGYPDIVLELGQNNNEFQIINQLNELNFVGYQRLSPNITIITYKKEGLNAKELFQSFSQIKWVVAKDKYYIGIYGYWGDHIIKKSMGTRSKKHNYQLFVMKNDGMVLSETPLKSITVRRIIPDNELLVEYFFYQKKEDIYLQLNTLRLKL